MKEVIEVIKKYLIAYDGVLCNNSEKCPELAWLGDRHECFAFNHQVLKTVMVLKDERVKRCPECVKTTNNNGGKNGII